ncbi:MAG: sugar ABC transporter substrate-binding protein [Thermoanaerobaculia bacterium]|nr:sugar ABC transporter substrate-binding protein [Thermoanaerobaculia bacterium]
MKRAVRVVLCSFSLVGAAFLVSAQDTESTGPTQLTRLTIATVSNSDMILMQDLSEVFEKANPDIELDWVILDENLLRQRVTTDIATSSGRFDVLTIGTYEAPIWAERGWLVPLDDLPEEYDLDDLLPPIREALSFDGALYAAPFYGESSFTMYRTDLFEEAGLEMPQEPTWDFIADAARKLTDEEDEVHGICLRGKPGWGENMAFLTAMANSYGARWFDLDWNPQFDGEAWRAAITDYVTLMQEAGPPNASANGYRENLALFRSGRCAIWIDATAAGQFVTAADSAVAGRVGFAFAPDNGLGKNASWLWAWALAIPESSDNQAAAKKFLAWATSKKYLELVASKEGWSNVPPGTRRSLYENQAYVDAAPFAEITLASILTADPDDPTVEEVPYTGIQYVAIPEFQSIGTAVGHRFAEALAGRIPIEEALDNAQWVTGKVIGRARFLKRGHIERERLGKEP